MQRLLAITHAGFGLFRVRSPLLTESRLFSFPVGTEMFHFPTFPPTTLCVQVEVAGHYSGFFRGFPIRRSPDRSSFTSSPGLIAGYNVLHRLLVPRHPPTALSSLLFHYKDARVHCAVLKKRAGPGTPSHKARHNWSALKACCQATDPSGPNSVLGFVQRHSRFHSASKPAVVLSRGLYTNLMVNVPLRCLPPPSTCAMERKALDRFD
jgi:hypothetical protein